MPGEHGLSNDVGEYNCFLNVVIQALWHLESFRKAFRSVKHVQQDDHATSSTPSSWTQPHAGHSLAPKGACVFCALDGVFVDLEFASPGESVDPKRMRAAMAALHKAQQKFQLREIDDAAEAFDAVVSRLHDLLDTRVLSETSVADGCENSDDGPPPVCLCFPHRMFCLQTAEETVCSDCRDLQWQPGRAPIERQYSEQFLLYTYAAQLRTQAAVHAEEAARVPQMRVLPAIFGRTKSGPASRLPLSAPEHSAPLTLDVLMRMAANGDASDRRPCSAILSGQGQIDGSAAGEEPKRCGKFTRVRHILRSLPEVLPIGIVWDTPDASTADVRTLLSAISLRIDAQNIFDSAELDADVGMAALGGSAIGQNRDNGRGNPRVASNNDTNSNSSGGIADNPSVGQATVTDRDGGAGLAANRSRYILRGLICYYGQHYMGFFWSSDERRWLSFDDTLVRAPGVRTQNGSFENEAHRNFSGVCRQCVAGRLQPNVLLYEREHLAGVYDEEADYGHPNARLRVGASNSDSNNTDNCNNGRADNSGDFRCLAGSDGPHVVSGETTAGERNVSSFHGIVVSRLGEEAAAQAAAATYDAMPSQAVMTRSQPNWAPPVAGNVVDERDFVMIAPDPASSAVVDVRIMRTNWFYRRDERVLRFQRSHFERLQPNTAVPRGLASSSTDTLSASTPNSADPARTFRYEEVLGVVVPANRRDQCLIRFRSDSLHASDPQLLTTHSAEDLDLLLRELRSRCLRVGNEVLTMTE